MRINLNNLSFNFICFGVKIRTLRILHTMQERSFSLRCERKNREIYYRENPHSQVQIYNHIKEAYLNILLAEVM